MGARRRAVSRSPDGAAPATGVRVSASAFFEVRPPQTGTQAQTKRKRIEMAPRSIVLLLAATTASSAFLVPSHRQSPTAVKFASPHTAAAAVHMSNSMPDNKEPARTLPTAKQLLPIAAAAGAILLNPAAANAATMSLGGVAETAWAQALSLIFVSEVRQAAYMYICATAHRLSARALSDRVLVPFVCCAVLRSWATRPFSSLLFSRPARPSFSPLRAAPAPSPS